MNALQNVTSLNQKTVYSDIRTYLRNKEKRSVNTAKAYERDIRLFFKTMRNREIEQLDIEHTRVTLSDVLNYQTLLIEGGKYKNNTINRMLASVESLYSFLKAHEDYEKIVNPFVFKEVENLPDDTAATSIISPDEAKILVKLALQEKHKGFEKSVLIMLAASTGIRKDKITKLQYLHISQHEHDRSMYTIQGEGFFDKGKKIYKEIDQYLFDCLMKLKIENNSDETYIFSISPTSLDDIIKRLCKKAGFSPKRKFSWHSLRGSGVMWVDEITNGDIAALTAQGNWSSPTVMYKSYMDKSRKKNLAGKGMFGNEEINEEIFEELTRDEMIVLLKSFGNGLGLQLRQKANEIINKRGAV